MAIFAPAWTWENIGGKDGGRFAFEMRERQLWHGDITCLDLHATSTAPWDEYEKGGSGFAPLNPKESHNGASSEAKVTSHKWCKRRRTLNLLALGISESVLDATPPPPLRASLWIKGTPPNCADPWFLSIRLLDSNKKEIQTFTTGEKLATSEWVEHVHFFASYGKGVRFIEWEDGGKDTERWGGHYGARLDAPSLNILLPKSKEKGSDAVGTHAVRDHLKVTLPFFSNFCTGIGKKRFLNAVVFCRSSDTPSANVIFDVFCFQEVDGEWSNLSEQAVQLAHRSPFTKGHLGGVTVHEDYST